MVNRSVAMALPSDIANELLVTVTERNPPHASGNVVVAAR